MALVIMSSVSWAVRKMILMSGWMAEMISAARMPASTVSISMSMRITSQGVLRARATISSPVAAAPTTSMSCWEDTTSQKSSRSRGKSSATMTRIGLSTPFTPSCGGRRRGA